MPHTVSQLSCLDSHYGHMIECSESIHLHCVTCWWPLSVHEQTAWPVTYTYALVREVEVISLHAKYITLHTEASDKASRSIYGLYTQLVHGSSRSLCSILIVSRRRLLLYWDTEWCNDSTLLNCCTWYCTFLQWCQKTPIRGNCKTTYA